MRLRLPQIAVPLLAVVLGSCGGTPTGTDQHPVNTTPASDSVATVAVRAKATSVVANYTLRLAATLENSAGDTLSGPAIAWASSDTAFATVDSTGLVTGISPGADTISATSEGHAGSLGIAVTMDSVATVTVNGPATQVVATRTLQVSATLKDSAGHTLTGPAIAWSSSDTALATVDARGLVSGLLPGADTVGATSEGRVGRLGVTVVAPTLTEGSDGPSGHLWAFAVDDDSTNLLSVYGYGYSYYFPVYPANPTLAANTQAGWGSWLQPYNPGFTGTICSNGNIFQSIEGGLGFWTNSRFPSVNPHFDVVVSGDCSTTSVGAPAYQSDENVLPASQLGLAQLSNRLLLPPDHLLFTPTGGPTLFGYGYISLPLIPAHTSASSQPTGDENWTLFLNTATLKGPVAFFTDEFFSAEGATEPNAVGHGLDQQPAAGSAPGLEICCTASFDATVNGVKYRRIPPLTFAADASGRAVILQDPRLYSKAAVSDLVGAWLDGGAPVTQFDQSGVRSVPLEQPTNSMSMDNNLIALDTTQFNLVTYQNSAGGWAFGFQWGDSMPAGTVPEYYKLVGNAWTPIPPGAVPRTSWLQDQTFSKSVPSIPPAVDTGSASVWSSANWAAGPYTTTLSDGSTVVYVWYKFVNQPAIKRLNLTAGQLDSLQTWVESLQDQGTNAFTFPGPSEGTLATIDPALIVSPPPGLTRGYVPIVIDQY